MVMEQHLKERLVGAIVLTIAAVILIPIILTGSPSLEPISGLKDGTDTSVADDRLQPFSSHIVPLGSTTPLGLASPERDSASAPATIPVLPKTKIPAIRADSASQQPVTAPIKSKPAVALTTAPAPAPTAKAAPTSGWLVQLGSFSNARNASGLKDRLLKKSYPAFIRTSKTDSGEVTRVFVGPSANRQQATQLAARLFTETHLKGMVIRQP